MVQAQRADNRSLVKLPRNGGLPIITIALFAVAMLPAVDQAKQALSTAAPTAKPASPPSPAFEVASIRENTSVGGRSHIISSSHDGNFTTINVRLLSLIQFAFNIPQTRIVGVPGWVKTEKFDIEAKADSAEEHLKTLSGDEGKQEKREMVQALLADRFQLKTHQETKELPLYELVIAKDGPKHLEKPEGNLVNSGNGSLYISGSNAIAELAEALAENLGRVVVDKTGLSDRYSLTLKWTPDDSATPRPDGTGSSAAPLPDAGPSVFTALEEQLGLKLESKKGPVQVLVIDRVEQPSAN